MKNNYNFGELLNKHYGNITNKHITQDINKLSDNNLQKSNFYVEGLKAYNTSSNFNFVTGLKFGYASNNNSSISNTSKNLIKGKHLLPQMSSYWEIRSYYENLKNISDKSLESNKLSLLAKSDVNKYNSPNIHFHTPIKSKVWKKIKGGYIFKLGTSMYFLPGSHFKCKKSLIKMKKIFEANLNMPSHFSLIGNRMYTTILQSTKTPTSKSSYKLNNRVIFKNSKQFSKKSKYIVSQKELKKLTAVDNLKKPTIRYNNSYYGKHLTA